MYISTFVAFLMRRVKVMFSPSVAFGLLIFSSSTRGLFATLMVIVLVSDIAPGVLPL